MKWLILKHFLILLLALPNLVWAEQSAATPSCEKMAHFFARPFQLHNTSNITICRETVHTSNKATLEATETTTTTITIVLGTPAALPSRVWRLNHWFDWVQAVSQGPGKAAPVDTQRHRGLSAYAGVSSAKKSWRPAQAQQRRTVMASAGSRLHA